MSGFLYLQKHKQYIRTFGSKRVESPYELKIKQL